MGKYQKWCFPQKVYAIILAILLLNFNFCDIKYTRIIVISLWGKYEYKFIKTKKR